MKALFIRKLISESAIPPMTVYRNPLTISEQFCDTLKAKFKPFQPERKKLMILKKFKVLKLEKKNLTHIQNL